MAFIDPFELLQLELSPGQTLGPEDLRRAKRKLLAEFELSDGITITYRGTQLDKAAAIAAVEQLEDPLLQARLLELHRQPSVLKVLRDRDLRSLILLPLPEKLGNADFRKYLSGLLAPEFNEILSQQLRAKDWNTASRVLGRMDLIDEWDQNTAVKSLVTHTRMHLHRLAEVAADKAELQHWDEAATYDAGLMTTLNRLPKEFQHLRNQYGAALEKLAIALAEQHERNKLAHKVITSAAALTMDANTADRIRRNQLWLWTRVRANSVNDPDEMRKRSEEFENAKAAPAAPDNTRTGCGVGFAVVLVMIFLRLLFSDGCQNKRSTDFTMYKPPVFNVPAYDFGSSLRRNDSLLASMKKLQSFSDSLEFKVADMAVKPLVSKDSPRYDTIFFRDLMFYEALDAIRLARVDPNAEVLHPGNGENLYAQAIPKLEPPYDQPEENTQPFRLKNDSDHDCIFFLETYSGGQIIRSYFVEARSEYLIPDLGATFYHVRAYHGLELRKNVAKYRGVKIPAFTGEVDPINGKNDTSEEDQPLMKSIFNFANIDWKTKKAVVKTLVLSRNFKLEDL